MKTSECTSRGDELNSMKNLHKYMYQSNFKLPALKYNRPNDHSHLNFLKIR